MRRSGGRGWWNVRRCRVCDRGSVGCVGGSVGGGSRGRSVCVSDGGGVGDGSYYCGDLCGAVVWCVIISMVKQ